MKQITNTAMAIIIAISFAIPALAKNKADNQSSSYKSHNSSPKEHNVSGYSRSDGTYVAPHYRSNRDDARNNNWTTQGNTNPHTDKDGTVPRSYYEKKN